MVQMLWNSPSECTGVPPTPLNCLTDGTGIVFLSGSCPGYTCVRCLQADRKGLESCTPPTTALPQD